MGMEIAVGSDIEIDFEIDSSDTLCAGLRQVSQFFLGYVKRAAFWPGLREVSCFVACVTSSEPLFWLT